MTRKHEGSTDDHQDGDERPAVQLETPSSEMGSGPLSDKLTALFSQADALRGEAAERVYSLEQQLEEAKAELAKIDRLLGRGAVQQSSSRTSRSSSDSSTSKSERAPRGFWLGKILEVLKDSPDGLKKSDLITALGIGNDPKQTATVSSTLQQAKKSNAVGQTDGRYVLP